MIESPSYETYRITWFRALLIPLGILLIQQVIVTVFTQVIGTGEMSTLVSFDIGIRPLNYSIVIYFVFWRRGYRFPANENKRVRLLNLLGLAFGLSLCVFLGLAPLIELFVKINPEVETVFNILAQTPWLYVLLVAIIAPLFEELIFRGLVLGGLIHHYGTSIKPLIVSSLLFGIFHLNIYQVIIASITGIFFGLIFIWTGSLRYSIILHALYNILVSLTSHFLLFLNMSTSVLIIVIILGLLFVALQLYLIYNTCHN